MFRDWFLVALFGTTLTYWDPSQGLAQTLDPLVVPAPEKSNEIAGSSDFQSLNLSLMHMVEELTPYRPAENLKGKLTISGSTTMRDLGHLWAESFKQFHPDVEFVGIPGGSEAAIKQLAEDPTIVAGVSRPVDESDLKILQAGKCKEPIALTVALEGMALFVHKSNPLESVSPETIKAIYAASPEQDSQPKLWGDVGVEGPLATEPIVVYERDASSGSQVFISRFLLGGAKIVPSAKPCQTNTDICNEIAKDSRGVGFADVRYEHPELRRVPVQVQGQIVQANESSILAGKYPIVRPLMLVLDKAQLVDDGKLRESILRYVLSRDGQLIVMKSGFFPLDLGFIHQQLNELFGQQLR